MKNSINLIKSTIESLTSRRDYAKDTLSGLGDKAQKIDHSKKMVFFKKKKVYGAGKMAQWVEALATNPGLLNLSPGNRGERREPTPTSYPLTSLGTLACAHSPTHTLLPYNQ